MLKNWSAKIARILGTPAAGRRKRRTLVQITPAIESLEKRMLPTAYVMANGAEAMLLIYGTSGNDSVAVSENYNGSIQVTENGTSRIFSSHLNSGGVALPVTQIVFYGLAGHDRFENNTALHSEAHGHGGNDTLIGGYGFDQLFGEGNNDQLVARGDAWVDELFGGAHNDYLLGSAGSNNMYGGADSDTLNGGGGDDLLEGGDGADFLYGQIGSDTLIGGGGNDLLDGGDDGFADFLEGGLGADKFQMEGYGKPNGVTYYTNLDHPDDYNPAEGDTFYGADTPVKTRYSYFGSWSLYY